MAAPSRNFHARLADNADTYTYFDELLYTYSLRQGIDDRFLAPTGSIAS